MRTKMVIWLSILLSLHGYTYATIAYIPQALRECITLAHNLGGKSGNHNVEELYSMIIENRVLASDDMVRKAVGEVLDVLGSNKDERVQNQNNIIKNYLKRYLHSLDDTFVLLSLKGNEAQHISWSVPLIARSLHDSSNDLDMMCLSSELTTIKSMELCGNVDMQFSSSFKQWMFMMGNSAKFNGADDPFIGFNANMMTNSVYTMPNVIFGTGASAPIINAWAMSASNFAQSPINIQFAVPGNFAHKKPASLELHFLVKQQSGCGKAAIKVNAKYMNNHDEFNIFDAVPLFTSTNISKDIAIIEPSDSNSVEHIVVTIPLDNSGIAAHNFGFLSLTRVAPMSGVEYSADIYLAAASFIYTSTDSSWFFW